MKKIALSVFRFLLMLLAILLLTEGAVRLIQYVWKPLYQATFDNQDHLFIYSLGESTTLGVPYEEKISPARLVAFQFNDSINGVPLQFIDLAESGKSAEYNYFKLYFELLFRPHKNGLVVMYSGINESINNIPLPNFKTWKWVQQSIVLSKFIFILDWFGNSPERYAYRYKQMIELARHHQYKVVMSQLVGNYTDLDPALFAQDDLLNDKYRTKTQQARKAYTEKEYALAESIFSQLQNEPGGEHPYLLYYLGRCMMARGAFDSAFILLSRVPEIDMSTGFAQWKNAIIEKSVNGPDVCVAKTFDRFLDSSEHKLLGYNLIGDLHHPVLKGYCLMAEEMSQCVSNFYGQAPLRKLTPELVAQHFVFDKKFYEGVYYRRVVWFIFESFITEDKELRLNGAKVNLEKYTELNPDAPIIPLWQTLIALLSKDAMNYPLHLQRLTMQANREELITNLAQALNDFNIQKLETYTSEMALNEKDRKLSNDFFKQLRHAR